MHQYFHYSAAERQCSREKTSNKTVRLPSKSTNPTITSLKMNEFSQKIFLMHHTENTKKSDVRLVLIKFSSGISLLETTKNLPILNVSPNLFTFMYIEYIRRQQENREFIKKIDFQMLNVEKYTLNIPIYIFVIKSFIFGLIMRLTPAGCYQAEMLTGWCLHKPFFLPSTEVCSRNIILNPRLLLFNVIFLFG